MSRRLRAERRHPAAPPIRAQNPGERAWWYGALLAVMALAVFTNALGAPFVFDDRVTIVQNPNITSLTPLARAMGPPTEGIGHPLAGRPVPALSFALTYAFSGLDPAGYRVINLAIHLLAALPLFGVLRRGFRSPQVPEPMREAADGLAFAAAAIWLVHPIQTEVVDYITQRSESLMGLFYFLTLYAAIRSMNLDRRVQLWMFAAVAACSLGMATKESMVTAPVMVLLYDIVFVSGSLKRALTKRRVLYGGLAASWLILAALNLHGPRSQSAGLASSVSPWIYLLNQAEMITAYLRLTVWPTHLILDYGPTVPTTIGAVLPEAILVVTLLAASVVAWWKWRQIAFLATWFWITLSPTSSIVPIATEVGAERRMYVPLAALATLGVLGGFRLAQTVSGDRKSRRVAGAGALAAVCLVLGWVTLERNGVYRDPIALWRSVLERKQHGRAHYNLAIVLDEQGHHDESLLHLREAARLNLVAAHSALGLQMEKAGNYDEAIAEYETFLRLVPLHEDVPKTYLRLGLTFAAAGKLPEAVAAFRRTLEMRPRSEDAWISLADVLLRGERFDEAIEAYKRYLTIVPDNPAAHHNLGLAFVGLNRDADAAEEFRLAVALAPRDPRYRLSYGNGLAAIAKLDEAVGEYRAGLSVAPDDARLRHLLGVTLATQGRFQEALPELQRAAALAPGDREIQADYKAVARSALRN